MKAFIIQCREAGNKVESFKTLEDAEKALEMYEKEDQENDCFVEDFYEIKSIELKFIETKGQFEKASKEGMMFLYAVDLSGCGDEDGFSYQDGATIEELKKRDWGWEECDDCEELEYFLVFAYSGDTDNAIEELRVFEF